MHTHKQSGIIKKLNVYKLNMFKGEEQPHVCVGFQAQYESLLCLCVCVCECVFWGHSLSEHVKGYYVLHSFA